MTTWWMHLSWSHAVLIVLAALVALGALWFYRATRPRQQAISVRRRSSYIVVDYSAAYERQRAWLGDRFLLAKPVNRARAPRPAPWDGAIVPDRRISP